MIVNALSVALIVDCLSDDRLGVPEDPLVLQACQRGAQHSTQEISESEYADVLKTSSVQSYQSFRRIQQLPKCKPESQAIAEIASVPQPYPDYLVKHTFAVRLQWFNYELITRINHVGIYIPCLIILRLRWG